MDYIGTMNNFMEVSIELPTNAIVLYIQLFNINNRLHWKEWFDATNDMIKVYTKMSDSAIINNRNKLKQAGLIDFSPGSQRKPTRYKIVEFTPIKSGDNPSINRVKPEHNPSTTKNINYKQKNKTETETKENNQKKAALSFDCADCSEKLKQALLDFAEMRKQIKKPMSDRAKSLLLKELEKIASTEEEKIAVLEQSILHGWQTVYPLKQDKRQTGNQSAQESFDGAMEILEKGGLI